MKKILILGEGTQGLTFIHALHQLGHQVYLLYDSPGNYADASRFCDCKIKAPVHQNERGYLEFLLSTIRDNGIDVLIPMGDGGARFVSENISEIKEATSIKMPGIEHFMMGYDKNQLMTLCEIKGYPHPKTVDLSIIPLSDSSLKSFPFPGMLKPNLTTGGRGMVCVNSYDELVSQYDVLHKTYGNYHLQEFIPAGGRQFKVQLYIDEQKKLVQGTVMQKVRWFPPKAGSNCCAVSVDKPELIDLCYHILQDIDWLGFADFDFIEDPRDGRLLAMEINPRVPACIKMPMVAGVNWAEIIVNGYLDLPQKEYVHKTGVVLRHLGLDVLWFMKCENRWKTDPNWFKFVGRNVYYQDISDWTDPAPFWAGTFHNIKSLLNPNFKKAKGLK